MKLAVVILNWNAAEDTERSVRLVEAWESLPTGKPSIWVVDNGSKESSWEHLSRDYPGVHLMASPANRGFAGGNNLGVAAAMDSGAEAILFLNNDASMAGSSLSSMLSTLVSDTRIGVVGPTLWDGEKLLSVGGRDIARYDVTHVRPAQVPRGVLDVDYVSGTVALVQRKIFEEVGMLDEDYFFGGEMADLCLRARRQGFRCVTDLGARATHDLSRSSETRETLHVYYIFRNRFLYIRKHYPGAKARLYTLWALRGARAVTIDLAKGNFRRARAVWLGVLDGLQGRFGGQNDRVLA